MRVRNVGLVLRTFATKAEDVPKRCAQVVEMIRAANQLTLANQLSRLKRVDVLVWAAHGYAKSDCGETHAALCDAMKQSGVADVAVHIVTYGDLYCAILNQGVRIQLQHGCEFSMIASTEAQPYLTQENFDAMWAALEQGAMVTGLAINELTESILEGRIANTMAIWHNPTLLDMGGFPPHLAGMPKDEYKRAHTAVIGYSPVKDEEVHYHLMGVEEVFPLAALVEHFGECIAPVLPAHEDQRYQVPDPATQPELWERHHKKMSTKTERQLAHLLRLSRDLSFLKGGVMRQFRGASVFA